MKGPLQMVKDNVNNAIPKKRIILLSVAGALIAVIIIIILLQGRTTIHLEFSHYNSNQGGFSIDAPFGELIISQERITFMGKNLQQFTHSHEIPEATFRVVHFDLPAGVVNPSERNTILNDLAIQFVSPVNGVINSTSDSDIQGYTGIHVKAEGTVDEQEMIAEGLIMLVANRVYIIGVYGIKGVLRQKHINTFINSLKFNF